MEVVGFGAGHGAYGAYVKVVKFNTAAYDEYKRIRDEYFSEIDKRIKEFDYDSKYKLGVKRIKSQHEFDIVGVTDEMNREIEAMRYTLLREQEKNIGERGAPRPLVGDEDELFNAFFVVELVERIRERVKEGKSLAHITLHQKDYDVAQIVNSILRENGIEIEIRWFSNDPSSAYRIYYVYRV